MQSLTALTHFDFNAAARFQRCCRVAPRADKAPGDYNGTFPVSVKNEGAVTGYYIDANNVYHGFLLLPEGY